MEKSEGGATAVNSGPARVYSAQNDTAGLSTKDTFPQAGRTVLKAANGHLIGSPRVVIDRVPGSAKVWLENAPWGWGPQEVQFLNPRPGGKAERYATALQQRVEMAAARELERRNKVRAANGGGA